MKPLSLLACTFVFLVTFGGLWLTCNRTEQFHVTPLLGSEESIIPPVTRGLQLHSNEGAPSALPAVIESPSDSNARKDVAVSEMTWNPEDLIFANELNIGPVGLPLGAEEQARMAELFASPPIQEKFLNLQYKMRGMQFTLHAQQEARLAQIARFPPQVQAASAGLRVLKQEEMRAKQQEVRVKQ